MIAFIKGIVASIEDSYAVIETNSIGYRVFMAKSVLAGLKTDDPVKVHTYMNVREDAIHLYGFLTVEELEMFNLLTTVSGVGPKVAIGMLSALTPKEISLSVMTEDIEALTKAPGIGKKTAQLIVLKLKDKLKSTHEEAYIRGQQSIEHKDEKHDAIDALIALGYSKNEALKAVLETALPEMKTEEIIRNALRRLNSL